jgi:hypothetical protein
VGESLTQLVSLKQKAFFKFFEVDAPLKFLILTILIGEILVPCLKVLFTDDQKA